MNQKSKQVIAIFSPNQNAYSETFIRAHKKLSFDIRFYYNGHLPLSLEGGSMVNLPWRLRIKKKLQRGFSDKERKLMYSLINEKVDAVLAEYGATAVEPLRVLKYLNIPLIVHFHGYDISMHELVNSYKTRYKEVFEYAANVIAVSNKMINDLIALGCPADKIVLNTYGPSDSFFDLSPDYSSKQFLSVGRFVEKKAPHLTILAFKKVSEQFPGAILKMVGDGLLLPICKDLVNALGLNDKVIFSGAQSSVEVQNEMQHSIAFVQHSVTAENGDSEGTPVAVLEAQAAALPVISTLHAGIPDVVIPNQTGLLCEEKDVNQMAEDMMRILREKDLAKKLGIAGRERIRQHFTMEKHLGVLAEALNKALKKQDLEGLA